MTMENQPGTKAEFICARCGRSFLRPICTIRKGQKKILCSRDCINVTDEQREETKRRCKSNWNERNKEKNAAWHKKWREKNRERLLIQKKEDYQKNKEKYNALTKIYQQKNKEKLKESRKKYYDENQVIIRDRAKKWAQENKEYVKERQGRYRITNRKSHIWSGIKKSAKDAGVKFDLTKEWIQERLNKGVCEMSGIVFDTIGKRTPNSPSVDRIKAGGDYTQDNCRMILFSLNHALRDYGEDYMIDIFRRIIAKKDS